MTQFPWLTALMLVPLCGALCMWPCQRSRAPETSARWVAMLASLVSIGLCIPLMLGFDASTSAMQFVEVHPWIPNLHVAYRLGVDGLSMPLVVLTALTHALVVLASWRLVKQRVPFYLGVCLVLQAMVVGVFVALDGVLFYLFWEGMLIPMYLCIGVWGSERRGDAAFKFFIYTFLGSAMMLVAIVYLGLHAQTFDLTQWPHLALSKACQTVLFWVFCVAFAIKVPMWPVHTWLPDAHTEAPAGGSVILAALMLKVGGYGFFRFNLPMFPDASHAMAPAMLVLALVAIVSVGLMALVQTDMKRLIAYSSVAHMGFVVLGVFAADALVPVGMDVATLSMTGGMVQMITHAFGSGAMFMAFGFLYERLHTRQLSEMGGVAQTMPMLAAFFVGFAMTNVGLPGTAGFVGEAMVLLSVFQAHAWLAAVAGLSLIVGSAYTLTMVKRAFYGPVTSEAVRGLRDLDAVERWTLSFLAVGILVLGVAPQWMVNPMRATAHHLIEQATSYHPTTSGTSV